MTSGSVGGDRRRLAAELRRLREAGGLSGQRLGDLLGWSQSKVTKIENGRTRPSAADVEAWAAATGADEGARAELASLAEAVATQARSWLSRHGTLTSRNLEIARVEREATCVQNFQPTVFPGLLQTADYARRVVSMLNVAGEWDVAAAVAARVERQTALYDQGRRFEFVLTEAALRWRPGPPELMLAQLDRLLSVMTLPNVAVGVLPQGRRQVVLHTNGFTIFDVPSDPFVLVETLTRELHLREDDDLAAYRAAFAQAQESAVSGADAVALIRQVMAEAAGG